MVYSIFLITHKHTRARIIHVLKNERDVYNHYSPREYMIEMIEKQSNKHLIASRKPIWERSYGSFSFKSDVLIRRIARGFKRPNHSLWMKANNPNKGGITEEHKRNISKATTGKPKSNRGQPKSEEWRKWHSAVMKKHKNALGWYWIVSVATDEEKRYNGEAIPSGWRRGRSVTKMAEAIWLRELKRKNKKDAGDKGEG